MDSALEKLLHEIDHRQGEIDKHNPLSSYLLKQIKEYFRIGLTYSSNALEGNSLTETETKIVLEEGIAIGGKTLIEHLEAVGHSDAFNKMHELVQKKPLMNKILSCCTIYFIFALMRRKQVFTDQFQPL